jgi:hypothetical protein
LASVDTVWTPRASLWRTCRTTSASRWNRFA